MAWRSRRTAQHLVASLSRWERFQDVTSLEQAVVAAYDLGLTTKVPEEALNATNSFTLSLVGWAGAPLCPGAEVVISKNGLKASYDITRYPRPDVKQAFGMTQIPNCGFEINLPLEIGHQNPELDIHVVDLLGKRFAVKLPDGQSFLKARPSERELSPGGYVDRVSLTIASPQRCHSPQWRAARSDPLGMIALVQLLGEPNISQEWYKSLRFFVVNHAAKTTASKVALAAGFDQDALEIGIEGSSPRAQSRLRTITRPSGVDIHVVGNLALDATSVHFGYRNPTADALVTVNDAYVHADGIVIANDELVIHEAAAEPCSPFVAGYWDKIAATGMRRNTALTRLSEDTVFRLPEAVILTSRCAANYFHGLIEHTPRLLTLQAFPDFLKLPMLVDETTPHSVREAIRLIMPTAELVDVPRDRRVHVDRLHLPLLHSFVPDSSLYPFASIRLSARHLRYLRETLLPHASEGPFPKRLFLGRQHGTRNVSNGLQTDDALREAGFTNMDMTQLSFTEQIALFRDATDIVGVAGASFANTIFCSPNARITALYGDHNRGYPLQRLLANTACSEFKDFYGIPSDLQTVDAQSHLHMPFSIPIPAFQEHLRTFHSNGR